MIPSEEECFDFIDRYKMPDHIRAHSIIVEKVAHLIAKRLQEKGARLSLAKVMAGALMHDIAKQVHIFDYSRNEDRFSVMKGHIFAEASHAILPVIQA